MRSECFSEKKTTALQCLSLKYQSANVYFLIQNILLVHGDEFSRKNFSFRYNYKHFIHFLGVISLVCTVYCILILCGPRYEGSTPAPLEQLWPFGIISIVFFFNSIFKQHQNTRISIQYSLTYKVKVNTYKSEQYHLVSLFCGRFEAIFGFARLFVQLWVIIE